MLRCRRPPREFPSCFDAFDIKCDKHACTFSKSDIIVTLLQPRFTLKMPPSYSFRRVRMISISFLPQNRDHHRRLRIGSGRIGPGGRARRWANQLNVRIKRATTKSIDIIVTQRVQYLYERRYRWTKDVSGYRFTIYMPVYYFNNYHTITIQLPYNSRLGLPLMTSAKFSDFSTPSPLVCKFTQPPLLRLLFH